MEQQYKTDAEIYAVLEREIIDLTIRPGSSLSENPLCARFGAPRSLIRVVLQKLQENGLVRIVPYKGTTVTRLNRRIVDELIYERTAVEGRILRDFAPIATPAQRAQIRARVDAYEALARAENPDFNKLYEMDCRLHETWFAAMDKMYLWSTLQNAHADYSRFRMLDTMTTGGLDEVIADHRNLLNAIERCDLAAFEPLVERHLYGGIHEFASGNFVCGNRAGEMVRPGKIAEKQRHTPGPGSQRLSVPDHHEPRLVNEAVKVLASTLKAPHESELLRRFAREAVPVVTELPELALMFLVGCEGPGDFLCH